LDRIEIFRPHNSFGGKFVNPGEEHRDWKSGRERNDNKTHRGIRYFKKRENLRRELREKPCDDPVGNRCAVNVAPLQLGEVFFGFTLRALMKRSSPEALYRLSAMIPRLHLARKWECQDRE
jgi:hypothetical protein